MLLFFWKFFYIATYYILNSCMSTQGPLVLTKSHFQLRGTSLKCFERFKIENSAIAFLNQLTFPFSLFFRLKVDFTTNLPT